MVAKSVRSAPTTVRHQTLPLQTPASHHGDGQSIEAVSHRTRQTKGCGSRMATLTMVFKLASEAERQWRRLNASKLLAQVIDGVKFVDGELKKEAA